MSPTGYKILPFRFGNILNCYAKVSTQDERESRIKPAGFNPAMNAVCLTSTHGMIGALPFKHDRAIHLKTNDFISTDSGGWEAHTEL